MPGTDRPLWADDPEPDALLRPVWEDLPDETDPPVLPRQSRAAVGPAMGAAAEDLLAPLAAAQDSLARLDARAETAPAPVRTGLIARLALREAAGWLASQHAWVHPHDLALRGKNLAGRFDTAAQIARPRSALLSTVATAPGGWDDPEDLAALAASEQAAVCALALARLLTALPRRHDPLSGAESAARFLAPLGAGDLDPTRFAAWRDALPGITRGRTAKPTPAVPPLLAAADAARTWMESGTTDQPAALVALALAAQRLARAGMLKAVPLPSGRPGRRSGIRRRTGCRGCARRSRGTSAGRSGRPGGGVFLGFVAEAARSGLRELDRVQAAAAAGRTLAAGLDRRSRLPAALDLVLSEPVVTPRGLADALGITLQAANRILAVMVKGEVVREVTGRGSFRAFGV